MGNGAVGLDIEVEEACGAKRPRTLDTPEPPYGLKPPTQTVTRERDF